VRPGKAPAQESSHHSFASLMGWIYVPDGVQGGPTRAFGTFFQQVSVSL
jgi:hypothetical protein